MKRIITSFIGVYAIIVGAASCGGGNNNNSVTVPASSVGYQQIERFGRPAIKEATEPFAKHDATVRTNPYAQPFSSQALYQDIGTFVTTVAGRDATTTSTIQSILIPDEMQIDLSSSAPKAAYLGVETGGKTGSTFGGRGLSDDVITTDLSVIFGNTLSTGLGLIPDDGHESPCLATDNVPNQNGPDNVTATFPYVGTPH